MYEHWVRRNERWPLFQGIFHTFSDQQTINFKDLYVKHPTKPNLWAYKGRNDDVIILSNSYKISPLDTEALVTMHPRIKGCLMVRKPTGAPPENWHPIAEAVMPHRSGPESPSPACLSSCKILHRGTTSSLTAYGRQ